MNSSNVLPEVYNMIKYLISRNRTDAQIVSIVNGEFPYSKSSPLDIYFVINNIKNNQGN